MINSGAAKPTPSKPYPCVTNFGFSRSMRSARAMAAAPSKTDRSRAKRSWGAADVVPNDIEHISHGVQRAYRAAPSLESDCVPVRRVWRRNNANVAAIIASASTMLSEADSSPLRLGARAASQLEETYESRRALFGASSCSIL